MRTRRTWAGLLLCAALLGVGLAGCPRGGGGAPAEPTAVEVEWPDAGVIPPTSPSSGGQTAL